MQLNESDVTKIRVPVKILDADGNLVPDFVPGAGELVTAFVDGAFTAAAGSLVQVGGAGSTDYYYQGVLADATHEGYLAVGINRPGIRGFEWRPVIGSSGMLAFPFFITSGGLLATGCNPSNPGELLMSLDGASFVNATGTFVELGLGYYGYHHNVNGIDYPLIIKVLKAGYDEADAWGSVEASSGSPALSASLISYSPADGAQLSADPEVARWTPLGCVMQTSLTMLPLIFVTIGTMRWTVFDGSDFTPFFKEHSKVTQNGGIWTFSILPNGGWWRSNIKISYCAGLVLAN